jgi:hypothetical protein
MYNLEVVKTKIASIPSDGYQVCEKGLTFPLGSIFSGRRTK